MNDSLRSAHPAAATDCLAGGGEMGAMMRAFDWSKTPVGAVEEWPQSLRTSVSIVLESKFPMYIAWGAHFTQFYNDSYRPILGSTKHPAALGISTRETFKEIWQIIGPMFDGVMQGTAVGVQDFLLPLERHGFVEECYFIFSYSPIRDESGRVGGVLVTVTETTERVLGERRMKALRALASQTADAKTAEEACALAEGVLAEHSADIPFALVYLLDDNGCARLAAAAGIAPGLASSPVTVALDEPSVWPLSVVAQTRSPVTVDDRSAMVLPIHQSGDAQLAGFLVSGVSPRLILDEKYRQFLELVAGQLATALANARALAEAQARAEALAEIDRAKTAFFSNVSHEFRTPLTLMLGPLDDALSAGAALTGDSLAAVQRNAQRLLKLVNTLLDFSRIEAGRVRASFEATDLARLTADLSSAFRSAVERAGLRFEVDCPELSAPAFVDHDMWEKIVLNLLSNAFKFTFEGAIRVTLAQQGDRIVLRVADTGSGIPASELPHLFERFHRIQGARARTHEGSGIGLALVYELVRMHGGTIDVESTVGRGTTFSVSIPAGSAHLPADHIGVDRTGVATATGAAPYVNEALRWLPAATGAVDPAQAAPSLDTLAAPGSDVTAGARILVADDNADMRDYLQRLLSRRWLVDTVPDGRAALAASGEQRYDIIISDVMMPNLDGFGLLRELRANAATRDIPLIMLSARAGEEARVEGLRAGVDDYLVKPFSARELQVRIESQLARAKIRRLEDLHAHRLSQIFQYAPVGIALLRGRDHVFEFANGDYLKLVPVREIVGKPIRVALPELAGQGIFELLDNVYRTGEPYIGRSLRTVLNRGPGGAPEECFFDFVYQPMRDDSGSIEGIVVVVFEVTELARARHSAEAANRAKDDFLAILGHELRNPLAPILTALQLMRLRGGDDAERERTIIDRQVRHLVRLVDDMLDVSRVTRGKIELKKERVDLAEIIAKAIEMISPLLEEREHQLSVEVPRHRLIVDGDPTRLAQVFSNILTNAAKYTEPHGRITVEGRRDGEEVVVVIRDSGVGIAPETLADVFELFVQERQALDRSQGGLGLGLAIVRSLVALHGGTVRAHSEGRGRGSEFTVRLPFFAGQADDRSVVESKRPPQRNSDNASAIMIVDDNVDAVELLAETLRMLGFDTHVAHNGPAALELAARIHPRLALLDIGLPVMDGYEVARRLRADPQLAPIRLVAITGYGQESDRRRSREVGFDEHLVKPIDVERLASLINELAPSAAAARE